MLPQASAVPIDDTDDFADAAAKQAVQSGAKSEAETIGLCGLLRMMVLMVRVVAFVMFLFHVEVFFAKVGATGRAGVTGFFAATFLSNLSAVDGSCVSKILEMSGF